MEARLIEIEKRDGKTSLPRASISKHIRVSSKSGEFSVNYAWQIKQINNRWLAGRQQPDFNRISRLIHYLSSAHRPYGQMESLFGADFVPKLVKSEQ